ncbi:MAG TPA: extracellular solute-binding protein [Chloroflexi bacterium]|nr:extracellular solute-binding protein [Chloroflexota bacterium]
MTSRRDFLRMAVLMTGTATLAACAPSAPTMAPGQAEPTTALADGESTTATQPPAEPAAKEKAIIRWISPLTAEVEQTYTHYWRDVYNEQNANVEVIVEDVGWTNRDTKIRAYIAAGDPPQMSTSVTREMYKMGWVDPLDDCMADLKDTFRDIIFAADSQCIYEEDDKVLWLGAPLLVSGWGIMARPDWIEEKGLGNVREEPPQTWDDLLALMKALHNAPSVYAYNDRLASGTDNGALAPWAFASNGLENLADFREEKKDAYIEVLDFMQQMWSYCSPDAVN